MKKKIYQIVLILSLLLIAPMIVNAEDVFEHEKINGNLFLKGKYIQLGINGETGVFGTTPIVVTQDNKETIEKYATTEVESGESLGMRFNKYGWDSKQAPTTGDFTVNATKENEFNINGSKDSLVFSFCYGTCKYNSVYTLRGDGYKSDGITINTIYDRSSQSDGELKAEVNGRIKISETPGETIDFTVTYWYKKDAKHFHTKVEATYNGTEKITNFKVMRLMNPDQDKLINRTSLTYNKVVSKARLSLKDPGYSMVVSRGETTLDGMFYLSFATNSYPALNEKYYEVNNTTYAPKDVIPNQKMSCSNINVIKGEEQKEEAIKECYFMPVYSKTMPATASADSLSIFYQGNEENKYTLSDTSISMLTYIGNFDAGSENKKTVEYYTSLDNDVISGLAEVLAEHNADIVNRTDTTITINTQSNAHYAIVECPVVDGEADIDNCTLPNDPITIEGDENDLATFEGLKPNTTYTIWYKIGNGDFNETPIVTTTKASAKKAVDIQVVVVTEDSVTIKGDHGYIYSSDDGDHWQSSETFDGLSPDTEYTFVGRAEETYYDMPGKISKAIKVKTLPKATDAPVIPDNVRIEVKIVDAVPTIKFNKAKLYEAIKDDEDLQDAIAHDYKTQVVFDVIKLYPNEEELQDLKPYMKRKKLAYGFDVEIKLYVNGEHIKDISELSKDLDLEVTVPNEIKEKDRKFFVIRKHIISIHEPALYEILDDLDSSDDTIAIKNDLFSEFYVAYEVDEEEVVNPKTGVNDYLIPFFISLLGIVFVYKESKNKSLFKLN